MNGAKDKAINAGHEMSYNFLDYIKGPVPLDHNRYMLTCKHLTCDFRATAIIIVT